MQEKLFLFVTTFILPVVEIDDCMIGDGCPGEHTLRLRRLYINKKN